MSFPYNKDGDPQLIAGRYRLEKLIGEGGVASVFLGTDIYSGQAVALKKAINGRQETAAAILKEYQFSSTHRHPTLVGAIALKYHNGSPVIVMPYMKDPGVYSLGSLSSRFRTGGDLWDKVPHLLAQLFECAAFIHHCGYVYNDFKPANFIIDPEIFDGNGHIALRLLDFNLVSLLNEIEIKSGTLQYTAPEVIVGRPSTSLSDLYSIGALLYEILAGTLPYNSQNSTGLIRLITESGYADLSKVPIAYRAGIESLLNRDPERRPGSAREAAEIFGVKGEFERLLRARSEYYLSAGGPPFADELKKALLKYIDECPEKVFIVRGLDSHRAEFDFISALSEMADFRVERIRETDDDKTASMIIDSMLSCQADDNIWPLLLVDDLKKISPINILKIRTMIRPCKGFPVVISQKRWEHIDLPAKIFDPLIGHSKNSAANIALNSYLKKPPEEFDISALAPMTGGDPELIYIRLKNAAESGAIDVLDPSIPPEMSSQSPAEINSVFQRMITRLSSAQKDVLSLLAVWGNSIELVLLSELEESQRSLIDGLVSSGHLKLEKDNLLFPSGDARIFLYELLPLEKKAALHRFWAEAVQRHGEAIEGSLQVGAYHWGKSDNIIQGYMTNMAVARDLFAKGDLAKAKEFSQQALDLSAKGAGSRPQALMLLGDILKQEGDYPGARECYLMLRRQLGRSQDLALKAEALKDLADLNRAMKNPGKALYYISKALELFDRLGDMQQVASCHNNIGLIHWVGEKYQDALASFSTALGINEELGNFEELGKIQSNMGIIKDITGRTAEVAGHFDLALENARKSSNLRLESLVANNLGYFYIRQNELEKANGYLLQALDISQRIGYSENIINSLTNLGLCDLRMGRLSEAIDYCQNALSMAESYGNRHLALDAEMHLIEVGILMGNFSLADNVLISIEADDAYKNNSLKAQVDILRSWWLREVGGNQSSADLARNVSVYADTIGDSRLAFEARLQLVLSLEELGGNNSMDTLESLAVDARSHGHDDLAQWASVALAQMHLRNNEWASAQAIVERVLQTENSTSQSFIRSRILQGRILAANRKFDDALAILSETDTISSTAGFLPLALEACLELFGIFCECGKNSRAADALVRAQAYGAKIRSYLPALREGSSGPRILNRLSGIRLRAAEREAVKV